MTCLKILVCSDSHGRLGGMIDAGERECPDHIFFLGDCYRGWGPDEEEVMLGGVRFLLTHGHRYSCKSGLGGLISEGRRRGVDMVCFGHTHQALHVQGGEDIWLFNPGSVGGVHSQEGYGVLIVSDGKVTGRLM